MWAGPHLYRLRWAFKDYKYFGFAVVKAYGLGFMTGR